MRKNKNLIINSQINEVINAIGHFQKLVICDPGLPIPLEADIIDISLTANIPSFMNVLELVIQEMDIEKIFLASEIKSQNANLDEKVNILCKKEKIKINYVFHEELKDLTSDAYCFIKTGETSVYANCIIEAGVNFKGFSS